MVATSEKQTGIGLWCNGNTADFGSVVLGSSPSRPTKNLLIFQEVFFIDDVFKIELLNFILLNIVNQLIVLF